MINISAVVTTFNSESTIYNCLDSLRFADEIILLDSYSTDKTIEIAKKFDCNIQQQNFRGFSRQKNDAIHLARNEWVILLDSDEFLTADAQQTILNLLKSTPGHDAYSLPRREWVFWKWSHDLVKKNRFVRLFNKNLAKVSDDYVHESVKTTGKTGKLNAEIKHLGETSIHKKIEKINHYSQLAAEQKFNQGKTVMPLKLIFYPVWYFFKQYFIRRQLFNGWAGLINAHLNSKYAFLKYSKLYELQKNKN